MLMHWGYIAAIDNTSVLIYITKEGWNGTGRGGGASAAQRSLALETGGIRESDIGPAPYNGQPNAQGPGGGAWCRWQGVKF